MAVTFRILLPALSKRVPNLELSDMWPMTPYAAYPTVACYKKDPRLCLQADFISADL